MEWAYALLDSSKIATCVISLFLIIYGSFRSMKLEDDNNEENRNRKLQLPLTDTEKSSKCNANSSKASHASGCSASDEDDNTSIQTLDTQQAIFLPIGASLSLLFMFFFFDSLQYLFTIGIAGVATVAFAFLLHPLCQICLKPFFSNHKVSVGVFGRHTSSEIVSFSLAGVLVLLWLITGHWILMDALSMGLCVSLIAYIRLPSLKVSTLLLSGLLVYDVFWVFCSSYLFNSNVMVKVATRPAENPVGMMAKKLRLASIIQRAPKLSLPGKLIFPSSFHDDSNESVGPMTQLDVDMVSNSAANLARTFQYNRQGSAAIQHFRPHPMASHISGGAGYDLMATSPDLPHYHFSMLGLGDIVMPGLLLCFVLRYDHWKGHNQNPFCSTYLTCDDKLKYRPIVHRITYFHCSLIGYVLGLAAATVSSDLFHAAQPALLYIVPATLIPLVIIAHLKGDLHQMWSEPFDQSQPGWRDHPATPAPTQLRRQTKEDNKVLCL